ncbi:hypothetical protein J6590_092131 [Homalodisca vitripennis]|nr:hypothetical protein J6590_092131 [Homalodisca vitripennis]
MEYKMCRRYSVESLTVGRRNGHGAEYFVPRLTQEIDWGEEGCPPIAEPPCGFRGEKCIRDMTSDWCPKVFLVNFDRRRPLPPNLPILTSEAAQRTLKD